MSSAPYTSHHSEGASPLFAVVSLLLGLLVGVLAFVAIFMWLDAHSARDAANRAAADVSSASGGTALTRWPTWATSRATRPRLRPMRWTSR